MTETGPDAPEGGGGPGEPRVPGARAPEALPGPESPARLPWAAALLEIRKLLAGAVGLFLVTGPAFRWVLPVLAVLALARVVQVRFVRWWVDPEAFVVERGILFRERRVILRARVQAVDLERKILHRLLGLTEVRVEALGGGTTQGALPGIEPGRADALRAALLGTNPRSGAQGIEAAGEVPGMDPEPGHRARAPWDGSPEARAERGAAPVRLSPHAGIPGPGSDPGRDASASGASGGIRLRLTGGEVAVAGLTESRLGAGIALLAVSLEPLRQGVFSGWFGPLEELVPVVERLPWVTLLVGFVVLALLFSLVLSFVLTVLGYWNFTLVQRGDVLEVERGLLTEHRDTVPLGRIQAVRVQENPFRRLMGLAQVKVVVAGRPGGSAVSSTNVILPVGPRSEAFALAARVVGWIPEPADGPVPHLLPMPEGARRRRRTRAFLAAGAGAMAGPFLLGGWGLGRILESPVLDPIVQGWPFMLLGGLLVLSLALPLARAAWRGLGWAELGGFLAFREGVLERTTTLLARRHLQSVEITSNPFQRRLGLATLVIPVARPILEADPRALDLTRDEAEALRERILGGLRAAPGGGAREPGPDPARGDGRKSVQRGAPGVVSAAPEWDV